MAAERFVGKTGGSFVKNDKKPLETLGFPLAFCELFHYNGAIVQRIGKGTVSVAELIAVLSGKGGTGKTSVCAGVATALAQQGLSVLCIDCDVGLRNLDIALGISGEPAISFQDVCAGEYDLSDAASHPAYPSLKFLTAPVGGSCDQVDPEAFSRMLEEARSKFRFVFLDAPAGIEAGFNLAAKYTDRILLVTGPDPASIRDAARAGELLELMGKRDVRMIVNRISKKMISAMKLTVDDVMDRAGLPLIGVVPEDDNVMLAAAFDRPLLGYTRRGAAAACRRIAKRIQGLAVPVEL